MKRWPRVKTVAIAALISLAIFSITILNYPEPLVRRLSWLTHPGAYAIYTRGRTYELTNGSIRMDVIDGTPITTSIQVSTWNGSHWCTPTIFHDLPIHHSTSFWVANDLLVGGRLNNLIINHTSEILEIWHDYDEADEGNSGQYVVSVKSVTPGLSLFVGRFAVECGLVTGWYYPEFYRLYETNLFLGIYTLFIGYPIFGILVLAPVILMITSILLIYEGLRYLQHLPRKSLK